MTHSSMSSLTLRSVSLVLEGLGQEEPNTLVGPQAGSSKGWDIFRNDCKPEQCAFVWMAGAALAFA
jgi:hypothetical protein